MRHGSLQNLLYAGAKGEPPAVGMGATRILYTDRQAYTVTAVEIFKTGAKRGQVKAVLATPDKVTRIDGNGMSEVQEYSFETDPDAKPERFALRKDGCFHGEAGTLLIGTRMHYHDFSF